MNIRELINQILHGGYSMEEDTWQKVVAVAYYIGRESATRETCDAYNAVLKAQKDRAKACRYHNLAMEVQGDVDHLYRPDYAGDMGGTFGGDPTNLRVDNDPEKV